MLLIFIFPDSAFAEIQDKTFVSRLVSEFSIQTEKWGVKLKDYTKILFKWLLIFEIAWLGIKSALSQEQIQNALKQFVLLIFVAGFFMAVIENHHEWSWNLIHGLQNVARDLGAQQAQVEGPFEAGIVIIKEILKKLSGWKPIDSLGLLISGLVVLVCFAMITARVVLIKCEVVVAMAASLLLLGFGASSILRDYAINAMRYVFSAAFKLFVMQLLVSIGVGIVLRLAEQATTKYEDIFVIIGASIILFVLINTLPETCAGLISGNHTGSGTGLGAATAGVAGAVAGAALGVGAMAKGAWGAKKTLSAASQLATQAGATGLGKVGHMAKGLMSAGREAKDRSKPTRSSIMRERLAAAQQTNAKDKG